MPPVRKKKTDARHSPAKVNCPTCGKSISGASHLDQHMETHKPKEDRKTYQCTVEGCDKVLLSKQKLAYHLETHKPKEDRKMYQCTEEGCDKTFTTPTGMRSHVKLIHTDDPLPAKRVVCTVCGKDYVDLSNHMKTHDENREQYECPVEGCSNIYLSTTGLRNHISIVHEGNDHFPCTEAGCPKVYNSQQSLNQHMAALHGPDGPRYPCPREDCDSILASKRYLEEHLRFVHNEDGSRGQYACPHEGCNSVLVSQRGLDAHLATQHSEDGAQVKCACPYEDCNSVVTGEKGLRLHLNRVHNEDGSHGVYACPHEGCGMVTKLQSLLDTHIKHHHSEEGSKERQAYLAWYEKEVHRRQLEKENGPYPCTFEGCKSELSTKNELHNHIKTQHCADDSTEKQAHLASLKKNRLRRQGWKADKREKGICAATMGCDMMAVTPYDKCLGHLSLIQPWAEALKNAADNNKLRKGFGNHIMTPEDMEDVLEYGLPVSDKYRDLFRQVRHSVEEPDSTEFCVDIEGSSSASQAYEISVFKSDGTLVLTAIVDWEMETRLLGSGSSMDTKTVTKIYKSKPRTWGRTRWDIAEKLKEVGMDENSTILIWGGALDIQCLRGTLGEFMKLPDESIDCSRLWRSALPGLPCHQQSAVYSVCFPQSGLAAQRHRAEADTKMLLQLNQLFVENAE